MTYTCPMHPQIHREGPGFCPICGMALEPLAVAAEVGPNPELVDLRRRLGVGAVLTIPVFVLAMGAHMGLRNLVSPTLSLWTQFVLASTRNHS